MRTVDTCGIIRLIEQTEEPHYCRFRRWCLVFSLVRKQQNSSSKHQQATTRKEKENNSSNNNNCGGKQREQATASAIMSSESDTQMETEEQKRQREWYEHYRSIFDEEEHAQFVQFIGFPVRSREMLGLELPSRPIRLPLANDTSLSDSQKVKFELKYLVEIFDSWLDTVRKGDNGNFFSKSLSRSSVCNCAYNHELEVQYFHDGHWYNSFPRIGSKMKGAQKIFYLQIPLVNNGYCYRVVGTDEIHRGEITLHQGKTHPKGIGGYVQLKPEAASPLSRFAKFAVEWFGSEDVHSSVYYNGNQNRVDILFGRDDFPQPGQKLMLEVCFEPGWPVKTFEMDSFPVSSLLGPGKSS